MTMTKEEFARRWDSSATGGAISSDEIAECAVAWGLCEHPQTEPLEELMLKVVKASGAKDIPAPGFEPQHSALTAHPVDLKYVADKVTEQGVYDHPILRSSTALAHGINLVIARHESSRCPSCGLSYFDTGGRMCDCFTPGQPHYCLECNVQHPCNTIKDLESIRVAAPQRDHGA